MKHFKEKLEIETLKALTYTQINELLNKLILENKELKQQLRIGSVMFELPETKEIETRLKHVIDESFEDYEVVEKREYSLGFRSCFNWLKIKQMKNKGN